MAAAAIAGIFSIPENNLGSLDVRKSMDSKDSAISVGSRRVDAMKLISATRRFLK